MATNLLSRLLLTVLRWTRHLPPSVLFAMLAIGPVLVIFGVYQRALAFDRLQSHLSTILQSRLEPTQHSYKGLVAYLLADIPYKLPPPRLAEYPHPVHEILNLTQDRRSLSSDALPELTLLPAANSPFYAGQQALAGDLDDGYLFVPSVSLSTSTEADTRPLTPNDISDVLAANPELEHDLRLAGAALPQLTSLLDHSIAGRPIVQSYLLIQSGLLAITNKDATAQYYHDRFPPQMFLPERPYFWATVRSALGDISRPHTWDYRGEPYIDIAAQGIVITYAKAMPLENGRAAVLCVDVQLDHGVIESVFRKRLALLGGDLTDVSYPDDQSELPDWLHGRDDPTGTLHVESSSLNGDTVGGLLESERGGRIEFTLPLRSSGANTTILSGSVDLRRFRLGQLLFLFMTILGTLLILVSGGNMALNTIVMHGQVVDTLSKFSEVMRDASVAFAWTDGSDAFRDVNKGFLRLTGYNNLDEVKRQLPTFRAMLEQDSAREYDRVLQMGARGESVKPYTVTLMARDGTKIKARIHGENISGRSLIGRRLSHRFGVIVKEET